MARAFVGDRRGVNDRPLVLGLRPNLGQFVLLAANNALVGTMVGLERTVVPILGKDTFHLASASLLLSFIVSFGVVKGVLNLVAGKLADRWGRKPVLVLGWLLGIPVPLMVMMAPNWTWIVLANILLGANQGFAWSMTVSSKVDLVGPKKRGLALGINEFSGYIGVAITSAFTGYLAAQFGPRPIPFWFGETVSVAGLLMAWFAIRETLPFAKLEASSATLSSVPIPGERLALRQVFARVTYRDRTLFSCSQAGMVNKFSDTAVWGLVPVLMTGQHFSPASVGLIGSLYAAVWGVLQLGSGAWSDRIGRKLPIMVGQWVNGLGVALILMAHSLGMWLVVAASMGAGTALIYPVLLSAVGDISHPAWRSSALGVYRMWRDGGYAVGGLLLGFGANVFGVARVLGLLAVLVILSGVIVMVFMRETLHRS